MLVDRISDWVDKVRSLKGAVGLAGLHRGDYLVIKVFGGRPCREKGL